MGLYAISSWLTVAAHQVSPRTTTQRQVWYRPAAISVAACALLLLLKSVLHAFAVGRKLVSISGHSASVDSVSH